MGKSLLISTLEHYYDISRAERFTELFGDLFIGRHPTPERSRYLILVLDFSGLPTDQGLDRLRTSFTIQLRGKLQNFFAVYARWIPDLAAAWEKFDSRDAQPADLMGQFLLLLSRSPHSLYILVDEYDNCANDIVSRGDHKLYTDILHGSGFVREFYKKIKEGTRDGSVMRLFMTGVTPVAVNDMASGFNIAKHIYLDEDFQDLCGFTQADVERVVDGILASGSYTLRRDALMEDLRRYYDGLRFCRSAQGHLYNPDMVLHFLTELRPPDAYPEEMLDPNLRTDPTRLHSLLFTPEKQPRPQPIEQVRDILACGYIDDQIHSLFQLHEVHSPTYFASYLYYLGFLSIWHRADLPGKVRLGLPNQVIQQIYGATLSYVLATGAQVQTLENDVLTAVGRMAIDGQIEPLLRLLHHEVLRKLSNRDLIRMDEKSLKVLLLGYISMTDVFFPFSEQETCDGYIDLCLQVNRRHPTLRYSYLIELKFLKDTEQPGPGPDGKQRKARRRKGKDELLGQIEALFTEAEAQLRRYLDDPRLAGAAGPAGFRAVSVVQVGTRALYFRELGAPTTTIA